MRDNAKTLIKLYIKEKLENKSLTRNEKDLYSKLYKECNEFASKLKTSGSILYNLDILQVKSSPFIFKVLGIISVIYSIYIIPIFIIYFCYKFWKKNIISSH